MRRPSGGTIYGNALRDGLLAGAFVTIAYLAFFTFRLVTGHDVALEYAVAQVVLQFFGFLTLVAAVSWFLRRWG